MALWSASSGVRHLLDAVDAAFGLPRASLVRARARGLLGVFVLVVLAAVVVALLGLAPDLPAWVSWLRYPLVVGVVLLGCAVLYRPGGATGRCPSGRAGGHRDVGARLDRAWPCTSAGAPTSRRPTGPSPRSS